jgi:hypothetical protein
LSLDAAAAVVARGVAALSRDVLAVASSRVGTDSFGSVGRSIYAHALALDGLMSLVDGETKDIKRRV